MATRNRVLELLKVGATLNGIDYVEVRENEPTRVYVHFLNTILVDEPNLAITIKGGDITPEVPVAPLQTADWSTDSEGRPLLRLHVLGRGDFSTYTLRIDGGTRLDPYFRAVDFSFFVFCPSVVDCRPPTPFCPEPDEALPSIDYLAKDYDSFRAALSDFSTLRYPEWRERSEADFGVVVMEALSAIGDELSYIQDEGHRQGNIETATARSAIVRLARLVDYEPTPVMSASALVALTVATASIPAGAHIGAFAPDGSDVPFEVGTGLRDATAYQVNPKWNLGIPPYWWDDDDRCLNPGVTSMYVTGHGFGFFAGQLLLLDTSGVTSVDPPIRELVTLVSAVELVDPLFNQQITQITWRPEDALKEHHDLTRTKLAGNLVPVTQGVRHSEHFAIQKAPVADPNMTLAMARLGANSTAAEPRWQYRYTIARDPVAYLLDGKGRPTPEVVLRQTSPQAREWRWVRTMLDAGRAEECFTLEAGRYRAVANLEEGTVSDYDGSAGSVIRFGIGDFGEIPNDGDLYQVSYRESCGRAGVVPADSITNVDPAWAGLILSASNPFPSTGGAHAETDEQVRRRAPQAFQSIFYRAVRSEDYDAVARRLSWVQRAGTVFRWTGSWPTIFTTADPKSAGVITPQEHIELIALQNRYRLAGYEAYAPRPRYVSFDIRIRICAQPGAFRGDVYAGVESALRPMKYPDGTTGFFFFDNFTLGSPFERSRLEAVIQEVNGVAGVLSIQYRRRGYTSSFSELPSIIPLAPGEIFRLDNDNNHPERGSYRLSVEGGK
jgi:hypothetical protein